MRSTACSSSSVRTQSAALTLATTCSALVAPAMTEATTALAANQRNGQLQKAVAVLAGEVLQLVHDVHRRARQEGSLALG